MNGQFLQEYVTEATVETSIYLIKKETIQTTNEII